MSAIEHMFSILQKKLRDVKPAGRPWNEFSGGLAALEDALEAPDPISQTFAGALPPLFFTNTGPSGQDYLRMQTPILGEAGRLHVVAAPADLASTTRYDIPGILVSYVDSKHRRLLQKTEGSEFASGQKNAILAGLKEDGTIGLLFCSSINVEGEVGCLGFTTSFRYAEKYKSTPYGYKEDLQGIQKSLNIPAAIVKEDFGVELKHDRTFKLIPSMVRLGMEVYREYHQTLAQRATGSSRLQ